MQASCKTTCKSMLPQVALPLLMSKIKMPHLGLMTTWVWSRWKLRSPLVTPLSQTVMKIVLPARPPCLTDLTISSKCRLKTKMNKEALLESTIIPAKMLRAILFKEELILLSYEWSCWEIWKEFVKTSLSSNLRSALCAQSDLAYRRRLLVPLKLPVSHKSTRLRMSKKVAVMCAQKTSWKTKIWLWMRTLALNWRKRRTWKMHTFLSEPRKVLMQLISLIQLTPITKYSSA